MVGIRGTSSFLIDTYNLVEQERVRRQPSVVNEMVFLMEDEHGQLIEIGWPEKAQNIMGQPPFYFG